MRKSVVSKLNTFMRSGICKLCLRNTQLCDSHALPNSLFNYVLRKNGGKAIMIVDDEDTPIRYSSDTWDVELLCADCERLLNQHYDAYGMSVFRGNQGRVVVDASGVSLLRVDRRRLRMFFLSVLWRISVSSHSSYSNIDLPFLWEEDLRSALAEGKPITQSRYTVAVYRMRDSTPKGGFSGEDLRDFIMAPFARSFGDFISVCYPFMGFFVETFLPRVPSRYAKRPGILHGSSPVFRAPYIEVLDIPEILAMMVRGQAKHLDGKSRVA